MMEERKLYQLLRQLTLSVNVLALGIMGSVILFSGYALGFLPLENQDISGTTIFEGDGASSSPESVWQAPLLTEVPSSIEGFEKRINDCIERSLNGQKLEPESKEMRAMVTYMKWLGQGVNPGEPPKGFGLLSLPILEAAADPVKGKSVYMAYCARCHGDDGEGMLAENGLEYINPPVYGTNSFNMGAGLYRISRFAAFVKSNMPFGVTYDNPFLTDEEAWNVAAYVNSMPRPDIDLSKDWPDLSKKPFDHPFGPYTDSFPEIQHKNGPFGPIVMANR